MQLKKHGIDRIIVIGLVAHTCIEATARYGAELGYEVTVVKDATADYSEAEMYAALEVNLPNYASAILATDDVVGLIRKTARIVPTPAGEPAQAGLG